MDLWLDLYFASGGRSSPQRCWGGVCLLFPGILYTCLSMWAGAATSGSAANRGHAGPVSLSLMLWGWRGLYDIFQSSNIICICKFHSSVWNKLGKRPSVLTDPVSPSACWGRYWTTLHVLSRAVLNRHARLAHEPWISSVGTDKGSSAHPGGRQMCISLFTGIALLASSPHMNWIFIVMFRADASLLVKFSLCG